MHAWFGVSLGDALITGLLKERNDHDKGSPLNTLYKLCINTTYGDMVSRYFGIGNVVVGNNITARARALAWYMEKGLNGFQTITDGCAFDLNRVVYSDDQRITAECVTGLYRKSLRNEHISIRPLGGYKRIDLSREPNGTVFLGLQSNTEYALTDKQAIEWLNRAAFEHLQSLFPNVSVLHSHTLDYQGYSRVGQFSFEVKGLYETIVTHGSANYMLLRFGKVEEIKMRSYSKKPLDIIVDAQLSIASECYYPARGFLLGLLNNAHKCDRASVYLKSTILKVADFKRHFKRKYENSLVFPGMTVKSAALLRECSLSQFTFRTYEQYRAWNREAEELRRRYGQTYEMFFLNPNGTLDYAHMVESLDGMITEGRQSFWDDSARKGRNTHRYKSAHPHLGTLEGARKMLSHFYGFEAPDDEIVERDGEPDSTDEPENVLQIEG